MRRSPRGSRRRARLTVKRWIRLASLSRRRSGAPPRPATSSDSRHRKPRVSMPSASHTLSNDNGELTPLVKIQFHASLNELRLRRLLEPPNSCTTLIASASTASIRRCSLESDLVPTISKNWLRRITSGKGRESASATAKATVFIVQLPSSSERSAGASKLAARDGRTQQHALCDSSSHLILMEYET